MTSYLLLQKNKCTFLMYVLPAGFSPPVFAGPSPPSPNAARPASGDLARPPIYK